MADVCPAAARRLEVISRPSVLWSLVLLLAVTEPSQQSIFRSGTAAVLVGVSVKSRGVPIEGLTAADFELKDNGVSQRVEVVSTDEIPLDVTLVIDAGVFVAAYSRAFSDAVHDVVSTLRATDRVRLLICASGVRQVFAMTPPSLVTVPDQLSAGTTRANGTLRNGLVAAMVRSPEPNRRHVILALTALVDTNSILSERELEPIAAMTDAVLYVGIVPPGLGYGPDHFRTTDLLAAATGGAVLYTQSKSALMGYPPSFAKPDEILGFSDMVRTFKTAISDVRRSYVLGYTAQGVQREGWHDIAIRVNKPGGEKLIVRARKKYFWG